MLINYNAELKNKYTLKITVYSDIIMATTAKQQNNTGSSLSPMKHQVTSSA
jgi:hypothetical protein